MSNAAAILAFAGAFLGSALALAVLWQERRSISHWAFAAGMLALAAESAFACLSMNAVDRTDMLDWQTWKLIAMSFLPGLWIFFSLSYGRGNYREFLRDWKYVLVLALGAPVGMALWFRDDLVVFKGLNTPGVLLNLAVLLSALLVLMNLERTFRASVGTMRWRIKFMVIGLGVLFAARAYTGSQVLLFHVMDPSLDAVNSGALVLACLLILRSLLRAGHFDVRVYPSHSVIQNSVTILLAGVYLLLVGILANWVKYIGGDSTFTLKAFLILVALVGLTILLLSDRARLVTRRFVSRHFQRPLYDYRTVWRDFTEGTASCMDQTELCRAAVKLIAGLFQVLSVTTWLADEKKEKLVFAVSTSLTETQGAELSPPAAETAQVMNYLRNHPEPADIDSSKEDWAAVLRKCQPGQFHKGGSRVCVPMLAGGDLLGLIILADRVAGAQYSQQDFDLLKCVGDQTAAGLRNVQLSQKLLQAKELEAFQTMSAFFVHDLKNTASTLNLMLQNLPVHFDDPAFREDALRGVSKTVNHINQLIGRLGMLRHGLNIQPSEADLNEVVSKALAGWNGGAGVELVKELGALPNILIDPEQMLKVVTNLVLNAKEAVFKNGKIRVATNQNNGWATLAVTDNGSGMSAEFMNRSLFRPFQTTKKGGFGIGMFQSKMIVEAHKGRMEVESELGKGTTFRVFLPIPTK